MGRRNWVRRSRTLALLRGRGEEGAEVSFGRWIGLPGVERLMDDPIRVKPPLAAIVVQFRGVAFVVERGRWVGHGPSRTVLDSRGLAGCEA